MCGIVGYIGTRDAVPLVVEGLKRLEYRGYDSSGIAVVQRGRLRHHKKAGKIRVMERSLPPNFGGQLAIAHTRWATHGAPTDENAHPHVSMDGRIAVVHNGIVENYTALKQMLQKEGVEFSSETDTEVLAHLIAREAKRHALSEAVRIALDYVKGSYGMAAISADNPKEIVVARNGSPIVIGVGDGEMLVASDVSALVAHTRQVVYLDDHEIAVLNPDGLRTIDMVNDRSIAKEVQETEVSLEAIEKGDFAHFMLKEIHEQPETVARAFAGRLMPDYGTTKLGGLNLDKREFFDVDRMSLIACGTSYHAGLVGSYVLEQLARVPTRVHVASELRYRNPIVEKETLYFAISQSGETADTLAAMRELQAKGGRVLGLVNTVGSTIARESEGGIYLRAGPEIAVASTKAFTSQVVVLTLFAITLGRMRDLSPRAGTALIEALQKIPEQMEHILQTGEAIQALAKTLLGTRYFLFLGRDVSYPVALEAALKLKEVSYVQCEGLPAAEMKHGTIALLNPEVPVFFINPLDHLHEKTLSAMEEVKARGARVIAVTNPGADRCIELADDVLLVPKTHELLSPLLTVVPLQLFSYYFAQALGRDVDQPRNLAKSVTVE